jgi:hypothetical protein
VASLASRREDITKQLGHLSGVIDALAVPEQRTRDHHDDTLDTDPRPEHERNDHE